MSGREKTSIRGGRTGKVVAPCCAKIYEVLGLTGNHAAARAGKMLQLGRNV